MNNDIDFEKFDPPDTGPDLYQQTVDTRTKPLLHMTGNTYKENFDKSGNHRVKAKQGACTTPSS